MATLLLSVMGAFAEFERSLVRERQREGIAGPQARRLPGQGAGTGHRAGRAAAGTGCRRCPRRPRWPASSDHAGDGLPVPAPCYLSRASGWSSSPPSSSPLQPVPERAEGHPTATPRSTPPPIRPFRRAWRTVGCRCCSNPTCPASWRTWLAGPGWRRGRTCRHTPMRRRTTRMRGDRRRGSIAPGAGPRRAGGTRRRARPGTHPCGRPYTRRRRTARHRLLAGCCHPGPWPRYVPQARTTLTAPRRLPADTAAVERDPPGRIGASYGPGRTTRRAGRARDVSAAPRQPGPTGRDADHRRVGVPRNYRPRRTAGYPGHVYPVSSALFMAPGRAATMLG